MGASNEHCCQHPGERRNSGAQSHLWGWQREIADLTRGYAPEPPGAKLENYIFWACVLLQTSLATHSSSALNFWLGRQRLDTDGTQSETGSSKDLELKSTIMANFGFSSKRISVFTGGVTWT